MAGGRCHQRNSIGFVSFLGMESGGWRGERRGRTIAITPPGFSIS